MIADRLTLDIDSYIPNFRLVAIRAWYALQRHDEVTEVTTHVSTSGEGIHLTAHLTTRLDQDTRMQLRRTLGDDQKRVDLDIERGRVGHATDICWTQKAGNDDERREMRDIWAALDHIEHQRASAHSRVKALSQHGHKAVWDTHGINRASLAEGIK
jgi:hypothetical protein